MSAELSGQANNARRADPSDAPFLQAMAGQTLAVPPIWLMRQAGRYLPEYRAIRQKAGSFLDLCYAPADAAEVTLQPVRRYGLDAAILFSDILVVPHGLGQDVRFVEGEGPKLEPIRSAAGLAGLDVERVLDHLSPVFETVERVAGALPSETVLIGFAGAPWTVATYMVEGGTSRGFETVRRFALGEPEGFAALIDMLVAATTRYLNRQIEAGAQAVQLFDSWAGVLPEDQFDRWVVAPAEKIVRGIRAVHPNTPIIGFPRGAGSRYEAYARATGVTALALDETVPLEQAVQLQAARPVQGNLDPMALLQGGAVLDAAIDRLLAALGDGAHVFNLGHGINKETPPDHVQALVDRVRASP